MSFSSAPRHTDFEQEILTRKVDLLYSRQVGGAVVSLSVSVSLFFMLLPILAGPKLYLWLLGSLAVLFLRLADYISYRRNGLKGSAASAWHLRFTAGSTAQGIIWGIAGFSLFPSSSLLHQLFLIVILCGMAGGAIIFLSPINHVYLLYLMPTLLPASIRLMMESKEGYVFLGILGLVYFSGMCYASWRTNRWLDSALRLTLEKETIAAELKSAQEQLEFRVAERTAELRTANKNLTKEMEQKNQAEYALSAEKERLAVTLRSIADGVITTDVEGKIIFLNKVAEDLTEWRQEDAVGRHLDEILHVADASTGNKKWQDIFSLVFKSEQINDLANHTMLSGKAGTQRYISISGAPIAGRDNQKMGVIIVFRDITEKIKMEEELLKIKKLESLGVLAGGIAHDFNNILTAILGNINLSLATAKLDERTRKLLSQAEKAAVRAKDLTTQLLTFSRGGELIKESASLIEVIKESATFVLRGSTVSCNFCVPDDLWLVNIDRGQFSQVVQNIVLNASQAMPGGGIIEFVCVNEKPAQGDNILPPQDQKHVKITIKDSGIGIPADIIGRIFDPYFSTKQGGSGLGLAITHSIIRKHGGRISVQSESGKGTVFTIFLPVSAKKTGAKELKKESEHPQVQAKILVMDDDELVSGVAKQMLTMLGHTVICAKDGLEAVQLYEKSINSDAPIGLIIMDLTIPGGGMGGEEAAKKILAINSAAKIVVSSGYSSDPIIANFSKYGFCAAMAKPYLFKELGNVVNGVLREGAG